MNPGVPDLRRLVSNSGLLQAIRTATGRLDYTKGQSQKILNSFIVLVRGIKKDRHGRQKQTLGSRRIIRARADPGMDRRRAFFQ
jgi:hypothetical protein